MQVQIKFTHFGSSSLCGNFAPGDVLRCSAEAARHLVDEVGCAKYVPTPALSPAADTPSQPAAAPAPRRRTKSAG